jgi:predicted murein hydrolase (TIGR00659 family)
VVSLHAAETWDWLAGSPLVGLLLTLVAYQVAVKVWQRTGRHTLLNPVLVAIVLVGGTLLLLDIDYDSYLEGAQYVAFFLGPATVALALPLHREARLVGKFAPSIIAAVVIGSVASVVSGYAFVELLGGSEELALSMAPKSATTPVSIALSESIGGIPSLTAVFTILAGLLGAVAAPAVLDLLRLRDTRVRGLAMGASSHGIGTARALSDHHREGAFSGLAMALTALATAAVLPLLLLLL